MTAGMTISPRYLFMVASGKLYVGRQGPRGWGGRQVRHDGKGFRFYGAHRGPMEAWNVHGIVSDDGTTLTTDDGQQHDLATWVRDNG